jgi:hypothetical protein
LTRVAGETFGSSNATISVNSSKIKLLATAEGGVGAANSAGLGGAPAPVLATALYDFAPTLDTTKPFVFRASDGTIFWASRDTIQSEKTLPATEKREETKKTVTEKMLLIQTCTYFFFVNQARNHFEDSSDIKHLNMKNHTCARCG